MVEIIEKNDWILDIPITKIGGANSIGVTIPRKILKAAGLDMGDRVTIIMHPKVKPDKIYKFGDTL